MSCTCDARLEVFGIEENQLGRDEHVHSRKLLEHQLIDSAQQFRRLRHPLGHDARKAVQFRCKES